MDPAIRRRILRLLDYNLFLVGTREREVRDETKDLNAFVGSWITQASFDPPLLAIAVRKDSRSQKMIHESGVVALSFLAAAQKPVAQKFFKDAPFAADGVHGLRYLRGRTGAPYFPDLAGAVECEVRHRWEGGDHVLYVLEVVEAHEGAHAGPPLTTGGAGWNYGG